MATGKTNMAWAADMAMDITIIITMVDMAEHLDMDNMIITMRNMDIIE